MDSTSTTATLTAFQLTELVRAAARIVDKCQDTTPDSDCATPFQQYFAATGLAHTFAVSQLQANTGIVAGISADLAAIDSKVTGLLNEEEGIVKASMAVQDLIAKIKSAFGIT